MVNQEWWWPSQMGIFSLWKYSLWLEFHQLSIFWLILDTHGISNHNSFGRFRHKNLSALTSVKSKKSEEISQSLLTRKNSKGRLFLRIDIFTILIITEPFGQCPRKVSRKCLSGHVCTIQGVRQGPLSDDFERNPYRNGKWRKILAVIIFGFLLTV